MSSVLTWKLADRPEPEYAFVSTEYGERTSLTLADGTVVALNAGSSIVFPEQFTGEDRTVFLTGEANFDVAKDEKMRFIVKTKNMDITALGTKFCVEAYPDDHVTRATLVEGRVKVDVTADSTRTYFLEPDMQLSFDLTLRKSLPPWNVNTMWKSITMRHRAVPVRNISSNSVRTRPLKRLWMS